MTIEVNRQAVSPGTVQISSEALRQSQIAKTNTNTETETETVTQPAQPAQPIRQPVAVKQSEKAEPRQPLAEANEVVIRLQEQIQSVTRQLEFRVDEKSGRTLIKVTDRDTGEIIREIPSEEMVELGNRLKELAETLHSSGNELSGLLVKRQA